MKFYKVAAAGVNGQTWCKGVVITPTTKTLTTWAGGFRRGRRGWGGTKLWAVGDKICGLTNEAAMLNTWLDALIACQFPEVSA